MIHPFDKHLRRAAALPEHQAWPFEAA